jgi:Thaumatin family
MPKLFSFIIKSTLLTIFISSSVAYSDGARTFTFINNYGQTIWVAGIDTPNMSVKMDPAATGFRLANGAQATFSIPNLWDGRFWGRTGCNFPGEPEYDASQPVGCKSGDCNKLERCQVTGDLPASLAEFNLVGNPDYYDVSLVDGYNLPMVVTPSGIASSVTLENSQAGSCAIPGCVADLNSTCPKELQVVVGQTVVGCKSACTAFGDPKYCCTGSFNSPKACPPTDYSKIFKQACPTSYSYAYDDLTSTFGCSGSTNYTITFGKSTGQPSAITTIGASSTQCLITAADGSVVMGQCSSTTNPTQTPIPAPTSTSTSTPVPGQGSAKSASPGQTTYQEDTHQTFQFTRIDMGAQDKNIFTITALPSKQCMQVSSQQSSFLQLAPCVGGSVEQMFEIILLQGGSTLTDTRGNRYRIQLMTDKNLCLGLTKGASGGDAQLFQVQSCDVSSRKQKFMIPAMAGFLR